MNSLATNPESMNNHRAFRTLTSSLKSKNGLTPEEPSCLVDEVARNLEVRFHLKKMCNLCQIMVDRDLFTDTLTNFLSLIQKPENLDFTFSTFASKGVLRLTGIPNMSLMKEEVLCLSSMMKLFDGYLLSDCSTLTLIFQMKSLFSE